ncbi:MAG TPA: RES family NAD+ phosphorylase [Longimicrobiaceae bacterium]|nr:RES family NAD+ phosphorylase [Longimicrobiaceae bacterium]
MLYRAHGVEYGAIFFGPAPGDAPRFRFDAPDGSYRVMYLGLTDEAAFIEGVIHSAVPRRIIAERTLAQRAISSVHVLHEVRVARLYGKYLVRNGADGGVVHGGDYSGVSRPWSKAIHAHADGVDGILYSARHDDSVQALALFDRAASKVAPGARHVLSGSDLLTLRLLDRYGLALEL